MTLQVLPDDTFSVAIRSRIYHADLLKAAQSAGGIEKLSQLLGVCSQTLSNWILLKSFPKLKIVYEDGRERINTSLVKRWPRIEKILCELTGKTTSQLFPEFVRLSGILEGPKTQETIREISAGDMMSLPMRPMMLPAPEQVIDLSGLREAIEKATNCLTYREREMLKLRFGLDGDNEQRTYEDIGRLFRVSKMRASQIIDKAIRKLQDPMRRKFFEPAIRDALDLHQCPGCSYSFAKFEHCYFCNEVLCAECLQKHVNKHHNSSTLDRLLDAPAEPKEIP